MSVQQPPRGEGSTTASLPTPAPGPEQGQGQGHGHRHSRAAGSGHLLMMLLMCAPMLLVVGVLVVTGRATGGSVLGALLCVGMMTAMMGVHGGHGRR